MCVKAREGGIEAGMVWGGEGIDGEHVVRLGLGAMLLHGTECNSERLLLPTALWNRAPAGPP